ncbi:hypothetical protein [Streptomyces sp. NPDC086023]|uniref:hypothetical protein n=1 Tax=unclassified Streptomyces TaxID=2593676 RepID=UPI0037D4FB5E
MGNRFASAAACLALAIAGLTATAGSAAADEQGDARTTVQVSAQDAGRGGAGQQQPPVPGEVTELICRIQASLPNPVLLPPCLVNGWQ